jgi:hypothetical protein
VGDGEGEADGDGGINSITASSEDGEPGVGGVGFPGDDHSLPGADGDRGGEQRGENADESENERKDTFYVIAPAVSYRSSERWPRGGATQTGRYRWRR